MFAFKKNFEDKGMEVIVRYVSPFLQGIINFNSFLCKGRKYSLDVVS